MAKPQDRVDELKRPPHSLEAEQAVIGGLMLENQAWDQVTALVSEPDFYSPPHRVLFRSLAELARRDRPFDVVTVIEMLKSMTSL